MLHFKQIFFDQSYDLLAIADMNGYFIELNPAWTKTLGWSLAQLKNKPYESFLHPEDVKKTRIEDKKLSKGHQSSEFVNRYRHKKGQYLWLQWSAIPSVEDQVIYCVARDITDLKEKEFKGIESNAQLARTFNVSKMAVLGEIVAGIAHEINNPLSIIRGRAGQLRESLESSKTNEKLKPDNFKTGLQQIENMSVRIANIVKTLRTFSRDSSMDKFEPKPIKDVINETLELSLEKMKSNNVHVYVDASPEIKVPSRGMELSQVLANLIDNSIDALDKKTKKWIKIEFEVLDKNVKIKVVDNGHGILKAIRPRIFEPFITSKPAEKGTGLGLSIAHTIIENHKGKIYIDETSAHTCFIIELPLAKSHKAKLT